MIKVEMKKYFKYVMLTIMVLVSFICISTNSLYVYADGEIIYGDIDNNGKVTVRDGLLILNYSAGLIELSDDQLLRADVNGDGIVNAEDAKLVVAVVSGMREEFPVEEEPTEEKEDFFLQLIEDQSMVTEGTKLRASTYMAFSNTSSARTMSLLSDSRAVVDNQEIKYFPVTMFNYDKDEINTATHKVEYNTLSNITQWTGMYFGVGSGSTYAYSSETVNITYDGDTVNIPDGEYYLVNNVSGQYMTSTVVDNGISGTTSIANAAVWTFTKVDDGYTISINNTYLTISHADADLVSNSVTLDIVKFDDDGKFLIGQSGQYLNYYQGAGSTFNGYGLVTDAGSAYYLVKPGSGSLSYSNSNYWRSEYQNYAYDGLVESKLDANKNIIFKNPDGGIFSTNSEINDVYTNVGLPFEYDNGTYSFDSTMMSARFEGTPTSDVNLKYSQTPQTNGASYGDGSSTIWLPYNDADSLNGEGNCDYYFGMVSTIPFSMTPNGRVNPSDNNSDPITFSFSGDDDIWIFVDGQLVLDLGGIHNRLDGTIDFATNTWTLSESNSSASTFGTINGAPITGKVFNDDSGNGTLNQTRESFAATSTHELTIFYLERGGGSANCRIKFNLPMKDVISVTKKADKSITADGEIDYLTASEQEVIDEIDFGFTIYKDGAVLANTDFSLLNINGQVISIPSTDANGHFTLKNGQTARFIEDIGDTEAGGNSYYIVEDDVSSLKFIKTEFSYKGTAAYGYVESETSYTSADAILTNTGYTSKKIKVIGSDESEDSLEFVCENYLDANLPNPTCITVDDTVVIDYGLPVLIPVLHNDIYRGDTIELIGVTGAQFGTVEIEDNKIKYHLNESLSSIEVLKYTAKVTGSSVGVDGKVETATSTKTGVLYVIPATSMYYEENFGSLVTYTGNWTSVGNTRTDFQETGFVGTVDDSPYGSDVCYITDSGDSYGKSMYVDTTDNVASFSYTFTGEGTSFFARTSNNSGYIKIDIYDTATNSKVYSWMRDTMYRSESASILYNIPVFTWNAEAYGTYRVDVSIAKKFMSYGTEFWLDGIRVYSPLNPSDANKAKADAAYLTDMEANCAIETLRNKLITDATTTDSAGNLVWSEQDQTNNYFVVFTDTNGKIISASEYVSNGPKEEVYLNSGQNVTFSLTEWNSTSNRIFLGIKAPMGGGKVSINNNVLDIQNTTDCYYDITQYASLTTDANGVVTATFNVKSVNTLISVTNIKVSGQFKFAVINSNSTATDNNNTVTEE